ncbi:MAG: PTS mannose/fructose/sorbose transporter subunit IIB [Gemmatimonadetes bacterium]|nr:MAG: PTS mannose/fructose/sorbose transporter subunit IIB [Gemmatimonadota bacterium]
MSIDLVRVDERLIHGQVVVGWGERLRPQRYVVADDELAGSAWEQELYALAAPPDAEVAFVPVSEARARLAEWRADDRVTFVLLRSVEALCALAEGGGLDGLTVNLGGLHAGEGRREHLPYLHLSPRDEAALDALAAAGVGLEARDLPTSRGVPWREPTPDAGAGAPPPPRGGDGA